jgi:putative transposase
VWASDIATYVWTAEGWLYLAVVLDLYSRMAVAWPMGSRLTETLATEALTMALGRRHPIGGLRHHLNPPSMPLFCTARSWLVMVSRSV